MRRLGLSVSLLLAALGGVAAASALMPARDAARSSSASVEPGGSFVTVHALADDPDGGPRWGVRIYESEDGATCPNAGRVEEGRFGRAGARGEHVPLPVAADGACADLTVAPLALAVQRHPARPGQGERGVVFGVVSRRVTQLTYTTPEGERTLATTRDGAFLAVEPDAQMTGASLTVTTSDGRRTTYRLDG